MGRSIRTYHKNKIDGDFISDDYKDKGQKESLKKIQCVGCGKNFTPTMKLEYCCDQCKLENQEMFSYNLDK